VLYKVLVIAPVTAHELELYPNMLVPDPDGHSTPALVFSVAELPDDVLVPMGNLQAVGKFIRVCAIFILDLIEKHKKVNFVRFPTNGFYAKCLKPSFSASVKGTLWIATFCIYNFEI
jgi:hypothetical protein